MTFEQTPPCIGCGLRGCDGKPCYPSGFDDEPTEETHQEYKDELKAETYLENTRLYGHE